MVGRPDDLWSVGHGIGARGVVDAPTQHPEDRVVDEPDRDDPFLDRGAELAAVDCRHRHLEIQARPDRLDAILPRLEPVGDDETLEAPLVLQDLPQEVAVLGAVVPVHPVVRAHDRGDSRIHDALEGRKVDLPEGALADPDVDRVACLLDGVEGVVLGAGHHVVPLRSHRQGRGHLAQQVGVLAVGLLGTSPQGMAEQVQAGSQPHVGALGARLLRGRAADAVLQGSVPARSAGHGHGEARGGAEADPSRAVSADDRGKGQPPVHARLPLAAHEASSRRVPDPRVARHLEDFLLEGHFSEEAMGERVDLVLREATSLGDVVEGERSPRDEWAVDGAFRIGPPGPHRRRGCGGEEQPTGGHEGLPGKATHGPERLSPTTAHLSMDRGVQGVRTLSKPTCRGATGHCRWAILPVPCAQRS